MKKSVLALVFILSALSAFSIATPRSIGFSDSYMLRAIGTDALYWNPASLNSQIGSLDIPLVNMFINVENNALDIKTYNQINGAYLTDALKQQLLDKITGHVQFSGATHSTIFGITYSNIGISVGLNAAGYGRISEDYLHLILFGNHDGEAYHFTKKDNDASALGWADITLGAGDYDICRLVPMLEERGIKPIRAGISLSVLTGIASMSVNSFNGQFSAPDEGVTINHHISFRESGIGYGFKGMIGLKSEPIKNLEAGLTLDNLFGGIQWVGSNKMHYVNILADSLIISDLNEDLITQTDSVVTSSKYRTPFPVEMNLGCKYRIPHTTFSLDYKQGFKNSIITSKYPKFALGVEYTPSRFIPLQLGFALPTPDEPYKVSYGFVFHTRITEIGFAFQTANAVFPGSLSDGFTFAMHSRILY